MGDARAGAKQHGPDHGGGEPNGSLFVDEHDGVLVAIDMAAFDIDGADSILNAVDFFVRRRATTSSDLRAQRDQAAAVSLRAPKAPPQRFAKSSGIRHLQDAFEGGGLDHDVSRAALPGETQSIPLNHLDLS